jgi:predicted deacylase
MSATAGNQENADMATSYGLGYRVSDDRNAARVIETPVVRFGSGQSPRVLFIAGIHGDEPEGPAACIKLSRILAELSPADFSGSVAIVPFANRLAIEQGRRTNPADSRDLNRCFGKPVLTESHVLAQTIETELMAWADIIVDLHSGGRGYSFVSHLEWIGGEGAAPGGRVRELMDCFGYDTIATVSDMGGGGSFDDRAMELGKTLSFSTETNGATINARDIDTVLWGLYGVLRKSGCLSSQVHDADWQSRRNEAKRILYMGAESYVTASTDGFFIPAVKLSDALQPGDLIGEIVSTSTLESTLVTSPIAGVLMAHPASATVRHGDCVAVVCAVIGKKGA